MAKKISTRKKRVPMSKRRSALDRVLSDLDTFWRAKEGDIIVAPCSVHRTPSPTLVRRAREELHDGITWLRGELAARYEAHA